MRYLSLMLLGILLLAGCKVNDRAEQAPAKENPAQRIYGSLSVSNSNDIGFYRMYDSDYGYYILILRYLDHGKEMTKRYKPSQKEGVSIQAIEGLINISDKHGELFIPTENIIAIQINKKNKE